MKNVQQQGSETAYRAIFEGAPVGMWDEDLSDVKVFLDDLATSGVCNIGEHLRLHPQALRECLRRIRVRHVNRVARQFYGAETEEQLLQALPRLFDETALDIFREEVTAFHEGACTFESELSVATLAGERRRVVMNVSMLDGTTDWSEVVVAFTDITDRRRLERSLTRANETLRRLNHHLEQFAYAAAHDLREPLRTIALYAQLMQRHQPPDHNPRSEMALKYVLDNAKRMETLVDDLLRFARAIEPESADPADCVADPAVVFREVLFDLSNAVKTASAMVYIDTSLPAVRMRSVHLRQLFQNLLSNAIKYRAEDRPCEIRVSAQTAGGDPVFCVADNGIGVRSEYHEQIFGIFSRLHGYEIEGNGIGLALCRKILEHYGGRIWVESAPDQGARFYFAVPTCV
jgi:signal transduction histidine kinase